MCEVRSEILKYIYRILSLLDTGIVYKEKKQFILNCNLVHAPGGMLSFWKKTKLTGHLRQTKDISIFQLNINKLSTCTHIINYEGQLLFQKL